MAYGVYSELYIATTEWFIPKSPRFEEKTLYIVKIGETENTSRRMRQLKGYSLKDTYSLNPNDSMAFVKRKLAESYLRFLICRDFEGVELHGHDHFICSSEHQRKKILEFFPIWTKEIEKILNTP